MMELYLFFSGCLWVLVGSVLLEWFDPMGRHDDIVMGKRPSLIHAWLALIFWPITLIVMSLR